MPRQNPRAASRHRLAVVAGVALVLGACLAPAAVAASEASIPGPGLTQEVLFAYYGPLSTSAALLRRMLSPLAKRMADERLATSGKSLDQHPVDLRQERFAIYVPAHAPPSGYGLLVFVPPWPQAEIPSAWLPVLEADGVICVTTARSGNDQSVLGRRAPLALLALENVRRLYRIDPARTYVGGFSGGSRVAERLALDYPDVFDGALLDAGADPIGAAPDQLPTQDLLWRFQAATRIAYVSGSRDLGSLATDGASLDAMRRACVFDADERIAPFAAHEVMGAPGLAWALRFLDGPASPNPARLNACRARLDADLATHLTQARAFVAKGDRPDARRAILKIDAAFGALAAPDIVDLAEDCGCGILPAAGRGRRPD